MKAYKIVHVNRDGELYSLATNNLACVHYIPGVPAHAPEWLAQKGYHLCAFLTIQDAFNLWVEWGNDVRELWEVEGEGLIDDLSNLPMCVVSLLNDGEIRPMNIISGVTGENVATSVWPEGTVMFRSITLIKRYDQEEQ